MLAWWWLWIGHDVWCKSCLFFGILNILIIVHPVIRSSMLVKRPFLVNLKSSWVSFLVLVVLNVLSRLLVSPRPWKWSWLAMSTWMLLRLWTWVLSARLFLPMTLLKKLSRLLVLLLAWANPLSKWPRNVSTNVSDIQSFALHRFTNTNVSSFRNSS